MKNYYIDLDVTTSVQMHIEATSMEEAKKIAQEKIESDTYYYLRNSLYVNTKVVDIQEEDE